VAKVGAPAPTKNSTGFPIGDRKLRVFFRCAWGDVHYAPKGAKSGWGEVFRLENQGVAATRGGSLLLDDRGFAMGGLRLRAHQARPVRMGFEPVQRTVHC
jgi:hypothetical protein